jgi:hypothetical protein
MDDVINTRTPLTWQPLPSLPQLQQQQQQHGSGGGSGDGDRHTQIISVTSSFII